MPVLVPTPPAVTPSNIDVLTLAEGKAAINVDVSQFDAEIALYVTGVSQALDRLCCPIVQREIAEVHDGGAASLWLLEYPVVSVTSVVEYLETTGTTLAAETNAAKTANDYSVNKATGQLHRRSSNSAQVFPAGVGNVVVTYVAGRFADTASVAPQFKLAASVMLANLWRREQGSGTATFGGNPEPAFGGATFAIPTAVRELLVDELRGPTIA